MRFLIALLLLLQIAPFLNGEEELNLPELVTPTEDGVNFTFWLKEAKPNEHGEMVFSLWAQYENEPVAINLVLGSKWSRIDLSRTDVPQFGGSASFTSVGVETERLAAAVAKGYGLERKQSSFTGAKMVAMLTGGVAPAKIGSEPVWVHLIHGVASQTDYAKFYLYINVPARVVEIVEFEKRYRMPMVEMFSQ